MVSAPRYFDDWLPFVPLLNYEPFAEGISGELIERIFRRDSEMYTTGRKLFSGSRSENRDWFEESRSYIGQALSFHQIANSSRGRSSALQLYYSSLNFAKAELLRSVPKDIYKTKIGHGLSYDPATTRTIDSDFVTVRDGVFKKLYFKRTGVNLPLNTQLPIKKLLGQIPEMGWEMQHLKGGRCRIAHLFHTFAWNGVDVWSLFATFDPNMSLGTTPAMVNFRKHYVEVTPPAHATANWRATFAVSPRSLGDPRFFESKLTWPRIGPRGSPTTWGEMTEDLVKRLGSSIQLTSIPAYEAEFVDNMWASKSLPMPSALARYAVSFYFSSLVRYRPSRLDSRVSPLESWIADAFTDQVPLLMLKDALCGFEDRNIQFIASDAVRN